MAKKSILTLGTAAALAVASVAVAKGKGILFPDWSRPTMGTYEAPAAELGKKSDQPWSTTTVASSIEGKTLPGKPITLVGEILDYSCYLQVGKHGDKHRDCGQKCLRNGMPAGLLTKDGSIYLLIDEEHNPRRDGLTALRQELIEHMAHVVRINGTYSEVAGQKAVYVQGYEKGAASRVRQ